MTHQPPVPEAATSPYPLHPAPIPPERKAVASTRPQLRGEQPGRIFPAGIATGVVIGLAAAAGLAAFLNRRRRPEAAAVPAKRSRGGDDKDRRGTADRRLVAAGEPYEVTYFARKHKISAAEARAILKEAGPDRKAANALAQIIAGLRDAEGRVTIPGFYDSVVGWSIDGEAAFPNGYRMIGRYDGKNAGGLLPLNEEMAAHGARPMWLGYVAVADVDGALTAIEGDGGKALMPAFDIPDVGRVALVADPQGAPLYIMAPRPPEGQAEAISDVFSTDRAQHVRWNELSTTDPDSAIAFYTRHFGWVQEGEMDMGELGQYRFLHHRGRMIGAVMPKPEKMPAPAWTFYIGVHDIDRAAAAVGEGGGRIFNGPVEIPGGEYAIDGFDPQGAAFGLVGPRNP